MSRVHIHFCGYEPGDKRIISGLRKSAHIFIYIDVDKAVKGEFVGYKCVWTENKTDGELIQSH